MSFINLAHHETPLTAPFPDIPLWSENFALAGFDPRSGIGLWLHLGRWRRDIELWRELVLIMLPDGSAVAHRGFGKALASPEGPGGCNLAFRVVEPQHRLTYQFCGAARQVPCEDLANQILQEGPRVRLQLDLQFQSDLPLWDLSKSGETQDFLGRGHIEQFGRLRGPILIGSERYEFDAMVNRDHSMGPRDNSPISTHQWSNGWFENGTGYMLYDAVVRGQSEPVFSEAAVYDGGELYHAIPTLPFRLSDANLRNQNFAFTLRYERGTLEVQTTHIVNTAYMCYTAPNEMYIGVPPHPSGKRSQMFLEQSAFACLNGNIKGSIHIERSVPGVVYPEP